MKISIPKGRYKDFRTGRDIGDDFSQLPTPTHTKAPEHKDVRGQIIALMQQKQKPLKTAEILQNINASRQSIMAQLNQLIQHNIITKIERGTYTLIQSENQNVN